MANWLQNSFGQTAKNIKGWFGGDNSLYSTPMGQNVIPTSTLTKAQKTFSSNEVVPNLPKPKSLYFVHFNLNGALETAITQKHKFIKQVSGMDFDMKSASDTSKGFVQSFKDMGSSIADKWNSAFGKEEKTEYNTNISKTDKLTSSTLVDYIPTREVLKKLSFEMSKLVKEYTKPAPTFKTKELNEYNRKRKIYDSITYNDVTIKFFDVKDNPVQQFFHTYLKFISGDFLCKDKYVWERPINNNHWQNAEGYTSVDGDKINNTYYGNLNTFGLNIDSHFKLIDSISFCEYYMDKLMVYTIENPILTKIDWGSSKAGDFDSNEISITFEYEGITNDLIDVEPGNVNAKDWNKINTVPYAKSMINREIKSQVAEFLQTRYNTKGSMLVSDAVNIMKGYMNGDTKLTWNNLKNQIYDTGRKYGFAKEVNTIAQTEQFIENYKSKDDDERAKYLINAGTDSTSLLGKITANSNTGNIIV